MAFWKFLGSNGTTYPQLGGLTVNTGDVIDFGTYVPSDSANWSSDAGPATVATDLNFPGAGAANATRHVDPALSLGDLGVAVYNGTTASTATAGGGAALPATVLGYLVVQVSGVNVKVPYYSN